MNKRDFFFSLAAMGSTGALRAQKRGAAPAPAQAPALESVTLPSDAAPSKNAPATGASQSNVTSDAPFVIAVNEGVTYRDPNGSAGDRFGELSADLEKLLKRPVRFELIRQYPELVEGLHQDRYDLAYVHPAHHAIRAIKKDNYRLVALTKGYTEYRASFMVMGNSPLQTLNDLSQERRKVGGPSEDSITSVIARATLREALGGKLPTMVYVRYQDAVPFMVENNLCSTGVSASKSVVKAWQDKGGRVLFTSQPVPIKQLLASGNVSPDQRHALTSYFAGLDQNEAGRRRLKALNVPGFIESDESALMPISKWLGV